MNITLPRYGAPNHRQLHWFVRVYRRTESLQLIFDHYVNATAATHWVISAYIKHGRNDVSPTNVSGIHMTSDPAVRVFEHTMTTDIPVTARLLGIYFIHSLFGRFDIGRLDKISGISLHLHRIPEQNSKRNGYCFFQGQLPTQTIVISTRRTISCKEARLILTPLYYCKQLTTRMPLRA